MKSFTLNISEFLFFSVLKPLILIENSNHMPKFISGTTKKHKFIKDCLTFADSKIVDVSLTYRIAY